MVYWDRKLLRFKGLPFVPNRLFARWIAYNESAYRYTQIKFDRQYKLFHGFAPSAGGTRNLAGENMRSRCVDNKKAILLIDHGT